MSEPKDVLVDLFADPTCPWCYVGYKSVQRAGAMRPHVKLRVIWRPFLLRPDAPFQGVDRAAFFKEWAAKDPARAAATRQALAEAAAAAGAPLNLDAPKIMPNAIDSQRVLLWALSQDKLEPAMEAIFHAYWVEGKDIGDADVLADAAESAGLDRALVRDLLDTGADREAILKRHDSAADMGVQGVPLMIFNRKLMAQGAQSPEEYAAVIDEAAGL